MVDYRQFTDAILQGANQAAPASSMADLGESFKGAFRAGAVARPGRAQGVAAQQQADDEEKRRQAAAQARINEIKDQMDPSKYQRVRKADGGFDFFDPSGKPINVETYARRTGQRRVDVLSDSENPLDLQFVDDYKKMNDLNQAVWSNDTATLSEYQSIFPDLFAGGKSPTPEELNKKLLEKYPHMFGLGSYQQSVQNMGKPLFRAGSSAAPVSSGTGGRSGWRPS